jgi:DNA repair protein RAD57
LETQDHILNYQLPVAISRFNVGLVVIDSIAANYRAEHTSNSMQGMSARSGELARLGHMLRNLAVKEDIAIVAANQVSDRFDNSMLLVDAPQQRFPRSSQTPLLNRATHTSKTIAEGNDFPSSSPALSSTPSSQLPADDDAVFDGAYIVGHHPVRNETLSLEHQQKFFTGWGDGDTYSESQQKTPALGFVWSTQIACRIALKKEDESDLDRISALSTQPSQVSLLQNTYNNKNNDTSEIKSAREVSLQSSLPPSQSSSQRGNDTPKPKQTSTHHHQEKDLSPTKTPINPPPKLAERRIKRRIKLAFAPWTSGIVHGHDQDHNKSSNEIEFEIWKGGIRSIVNQSIDQS